MKLVHVLMRPEHVYQGFLCSTGTDILDEK